MTTVQFQVDATAAINTAKVLAAAIGKASEKIKIDTAGILNHVAKNHGRDAKTNLAPKFIAVAPTVVSRAFRQGKIKARKDSLATIVEVSQSRTDRRQSYKRFQAQQTAAGVSWKPSVDEPRKIIKGAFGPKITKRLNKHVFKRQGKPRLPIQKLYGPSFYAWYRSRNLKNTFSVPAMQKQLESEVLKRVRSIISGVAA